MHVTDTCKHTFIRRIDYLLYNLTCHFMQKHIHLKYMNKKLIPLGLPVWFLYGAALCSSCNAVAVWSALLEGPRLGDFYSDSEVFIVFRSPSRKMLGYCLKLGNTTSFPVFSHSLFVVHPII